MKEVCWQELYGKQRGVSEHSGEQGFGMTMPGRSYLSDIYRYGFNGKEVDKALSVGDLDFGERIYDVRIGRSLSVDRLQHKYPGIGTYNFCLGNPILFVDPDGKGVILLDRGGYQVAVIKADGNIIASKGYEKSVEIHNYKDARDYLKNKGGSSTLTDLESHKKTTYIKFSSDDFASPVNPTGSAQFTPKEDINAIRYADQNGNNQLDPAEDNTVVGLDPKVNGTIVWNPEKGLIDAEGNYHSPALVLEHEAKHAKHHLRFGQYIRDKLKKLIGGRTNQEEANTIDETNEVSKKLNNEDGGNENGLNMKGVVQRTSRE